MSSFFDLLSFLESKNCKLVAVSKTKPASAIMELYEHGQRIFGENRVQELLEKHELLPKDIEWHLIGHLQKNKVKYIAPFVSMIHSIDNLELLQMVNKKAKDNDRTIDVLLQIKIASEESKYGFDIETLLADLDTGSLNNVNFRGVMGMATFTDNLDQVRSEFQSLSLSFRKLKKLHFSTQESFSEISMGMSGDYKLAVEEGSTMVRIGSLLFGNRS